MLILLVGEFRHQIHVVDGVDIRARFILLELIELLLEFCDLISTPSLSSRVAVLDKIVLDLLDVLKHLGMGLFEVAALTEDWVHHAKVREWEWDVKKHR